MARKLLGPGRMFNPSWTGPHTVVNIVSDVLYEIDRDGGYVTYHVDNLRPVPEGNESEEDGESPSEEESSDDGSSDDGSDAPPPDELPHNARVDSAESGQLANAPASIQIKPQLDSCPAGTSRPERSTAQQPAPTRPEQTPGGSQRRGPIGPERSASPVTCTNQSDQSTTENCPAGTLAPERSVARQPVNSRLSLQPQDSLASRPERLERLPSTPTVYSEGTDQPRPITVPTTTPRPAQPGQYRPRKRRRARIVILDRDPTPPRDPTEGTSN